MVSRAGRRRARASAEAEQVVLKRAVVKVPEQVLVRVQRLVDAKPAAALAPPRARTLAAREKVVAALKKLHPMD